MATILYLRCDEAGCTTTYHPDVELKVITISEFRHGSKKAGWARRKSRDLCPTHS